MIMELAVLRPNEELIRACMLERELRLFISDFPDRMEIMDGVEVMYNKKQENPNGLLMDGDKIKDCLCGVVLFVAYDKEGNLTSLSDQQLNDLKANIETFPASQFTTYKRIYLKK